MAVERVCVSLAMTMLLVVLLVLEKACGESGSGSEGEDPCGIMLQPSGECGVSGPTISGSTSSSLAILSAMPSPAATLPPATTVMPSGTPPLSVALTTPTVVSFILLPSPTEDRAAGGRGRREGGGSSGLQLGRGAVTGIVLGGLWLALLVLVVCLALGHWARGRRWRKGANQGQQYRRHRDA